MKETILIIDDETNIRLSLAGILEDEGFVTRGAASGEAGLEAVRKEQPELVFLDIWMPGIDGMETLKRLKESHPFLPVIMMSGHGTIETAVKATKMGAYDFIEKPLSLEKILVTVANALAMSRLREENRTLRTLVVQDHVMVGDSPVMKSLREQLLLIASSDVPVLITGESGTGKELAAEAVHKASPRAGQPFVALNCGAIPRDLLESEVFGHVKGAFTGATADRPGAAKLADSGTLFLDEIAEMPLEMQVKLLRFVQTGTFSAVGSGKVEKVDVRFVCATNRDPLLEVQAGRFREDLYYRLYVVPVELPPLRERGEDVLLIARHFLTVYTREEHRRFRGFSAEAERRLLAYSWPGNVRQLQNVVRNIVVLHDAERVEAEMLPVLLHRAVLAPVAAPPPMTAPPVAELPVAELPVAAPPVAEPPVAVSAAAAPEPVVYVQPAPPPVRAAAEPPPLPTLPPVPEEDVVMPLAVMERRLINAALRRTGNDVPRAAALLEVNPSTIYRKLQAWRSEGSAA